MRLLSESDAENKKNNIPLLGEIIYFTNGIAKIGDGKTRLIDLPECTNRDFVPVEFFKDNEELNKYLIEWKLKLYLDNWSIKCYLVEQKELEDEISGCVNFNKTHDCAVIKIANIPYNDKMNFIMKQPQELVLVHELLHIVLNLSADNVYTDEQKEIYNYRHNTLDRLARALIAEKYNLSRDWFKNF